MPIIKYITFIFLRSAFWKDILSQIIDNHQLY